MLFGIQVFFGIYFGGILKFWYFGGISNVVIIERSLCIEQLAISYMSTVHECIQDLCWTILITSHVLYINSLEVQKKMLWSNLVSNAVIYVGKKNQTSKVGSVKGFPRPTVLVIFCEKSTQPNGFSLTQSYKETRHFSFSRVTNPRALGFCSSLSGWDLNLASLRPPA